MTLDTELDANDLKKLVVEFKQTYKNSKERNFPKTPRSSSYRRFLRCSRAWDNPRAIYYRRMNDIPSDWGTAVNVQSMVFGNMGEDSGTGVAFTRNPATGEKQLFGEYLMNAQGEDVVAGIRTPQSIAQLEKAEQGGLRTVCRHLQNPRRPLQGYAGHGVHNRKRQALYASNAQRQAYRRRRAQNSH